MGERIRVRNSEGKRVNMFDLFDNKITEAKHGKKKKKRKSKATGGKRKNPRY